MATTTAVHLLRKPAGTDLVNVTTDLSDNMDRIEKVPRGEMGYAELLANSAALPNTPGVPTDVAGWATAAIALKAGRKIKVTLSCMIQSSVVTDTIELYLVKDYPAANTVFDIVIGKPSIANDPGSLTGVARFVQAADANVTFKVRGARRAGSGVCIVTGNAAYPAMLLVEDMGAA